MTDRVGQQLGNYRIIRLIGHGGFADVYTVFAKVYGEKFTGFIVERGFKGFTRGPEEHKMGIKSSSTVQLFFQDCKVPVENILGEIGRGHLIAFNILTVKTKNNFIRSNLCPARLYREIQIRLSGIDSNRNRRHERET